MIIDWFRVQSFWGGQKTSIAVGIQPCGTAEISVEAESLSRQSTRQSVPASFPSNTLNSSIRLCNPDAPSTLISIHRVSSCLCPAQQPSSRIHENLPSSFRTGLRARSALLRISELDMD